MGKELYKNMWIVKGGCTLSQPCGTCTCIEHIAPKERAPITIETKLRDLDTLARMCVDGMGGAEVINNLDENFQSSKRFMGRQA